MIWAPLEASAGKKNGYLRRSNLPGLGRASQNESKLEGIVEAAETLEQKSD